MKVAKFISEKAGISVGEAKRLIQCNAVVINNELIKDREAELNFENEGQILRVGRKREFTILIIKGD